MSLTAVGFHDDQPINPHLSVIGGCGIVLLHPYDPNQLWFEFMRGVVLRKTTFEDDELTHNQLRVKHFKSLSKIAAAEKQEMMANDEHVRPMHKFETGVHQLPIPFAEHFRLNGVQFSAISSSQNFGWERTASGKTYAVDFRESDRERIEAWCAEQCSGFYYIKKKGRAFFSKGVDAVGAAIWFQKPA